MSALKTKKFLECFQVSIVPFTARFVLSLFCIYSELIVNAKYSDEVISTETGIIILIIIVHVDLCFLSKCKKIILKLVVLLSISIIILICCYSWYILIYT